MSTVSRVVVTFNTGVVVDENDWNSNLPADFEADNRTVSIEITLKETTGTAINNVKAKSLAGTPVDVWIRSGNTEGNAFGWFLENVEFTPHERSDGERSMNVDLSGQATADAGSINELAMFAG